MNSQNTIINIKKSDYFKLPPTMREMSEEGAMVLTVIQGRSTFVLVNMLE